MWEVGVQFSVAINMKNEFWLLRLNTRTIISRNDNGVLYTRRVLWVYINDAFKLRRRLRRNMLDSFLCSTIGPFHMNKYITIVGKKHTYVH